MKNRVSNAWGPPSEVPESAVEEEAVAELGDEDAGGGADCLGGLEAGGGMLAPGVAVVRGGGGGGGRFGGWPVSMAKHGVTAASDVATHAARKIPRLRTARGCSPIWSSVKSMVRRSRPPGHAVIRRK
jgi:hypothetical protein